MQHLCHAQTNKSDKSKYDGDVDACDKDGDYDCNKSNKEDNNDYNDKITIEYGANWLQGASEDNPIYNLTVNDCKLETYQDHFDINSSNVFSLSCSNTSSLTYTKDGKTAPCVKPQVVRYTDEQIENVEDRIEQTYDQIKEYLDSCLFIGTSSYHTDKSNNERNDNSKSNNKSNSESNSESNDKSIGSGCLIQDVSVRTLLRQFEWHPKTQLERMFDYFKIDFGMQNT